MYVNIIGFIVGLILVVVTRIAINVSTADYSTNSILIRIQSLFFGTVGHKGRS